ncbi:MAG: hypothetical protein ABIH92_03645 [Nanoarchaeota archaeon]
MPESIIKRRKMEFLFLLNGIVILLIAVFLVGGFLKYYRKERVGKLIHWFSILLFPYFALFIYSVFWLGDVFVYSASDFNFIYSLAILVQTLVLFKVSYLLNGKKSIFYWLFFYFAALLSFYISVSYFQLFVLIISFFLTLIISFNFMSSFRSLKRVGFVGFLYSCTAIILQFFLFFGVGEPFLYSLTLNAIFLVFVIFFLKNVRRYRLKDLGRVKMKREHGVILFIKYFVFIIVLVNLVLVATVSVHEFSHVFVSRVYGCESKTIVYEDGSYPYSEILCNNLENKVPIALAGPLVPLIIAVFLFIIGGHYIRSISFLLAGFNLIASYMDFKEVGLTNNLVVATLIVGAIFLVIGVVQLARARMKDHDHQFL